MTYYFILIDTVKFNTLRSIYKRVAPTNNTIFMCGRTEERTDHNRSYIKITPTPRFPELFIFLLFINRKRRQI